MERLNHRPKHQKKQQDEWQDEFLNENGEPEEVKQSLNLFHRDSNDQIRGLGAPELNDAQLGQSSLQSPIPGMNMREFLASLVILSVTFAIATHLFQRISRYCRTEEKKTTPESGGTNHPTRSRIEYNRQDAAQYETEPDSPAVEHLQTVSFAEKAGRHAIDNQSFGYESCDSRRSGSSLKSSQSKKSTLSGRLIKSAKKFIGMGEGTKYNPKRAEVIEDDDEDNEDDDELNEENVNNEIDILHLS